MSDDPIITHYERTCMKACDWKAHRKDYDGGDPPDPCGLGATEAQAIADLLDKEAARRGE